MPQRLYLIDGYSNIFRAFYAIRNLSSSKGEPTNAVYGFIQMLKKLLKDEEPELIGVALDVSRRTVRSEKFPEYKANRSPMPDDLRSQVPWIRQALEAFRIPIEELPEYEADDVMGTLAAKASAAGYEVVLVSADKDLMQLVTDKVKLFHTGRDKLYDPALVEEDFGVAPALVPDALALMGDASDNVPGVKGIGAKGAIKLLAAFGSLAELLDRAGEVSRKSYRESLEENRDAAELSLDLVTIHTDLPIPFEPEKLRYEKPDEEKLRALYGELEFFSLLDELGASATADELPAAREIDDPAVWRRRLAELAEETRRESNGGGLTLSLIGRAAGEEEPLGLAVSAGVAEDGSEEDGSEEDGSEEDGSEEDGGAEDGSAGDGGEEVLYADFRRDGMREATLEALEALLGDPGLRLAGHDLKELLRLSPAGPRCRAHLADLMLVSYLLRPAQSHGLDEIALERLGLKAISREEAGWGKGVEPTLGDERLLAYAGERVALAGRLLAAMEPQLDGALAEIYRTMEEPLLAVLVGMEETGVLLDVEFLASMSAELGGELEGLEGQIHELAGESFNINSPQQLGAILFDKLGLPVLKKTKKTKSYSTGADVLEELAARGHQLPERILRYREIAKLKSTYVDALPALVSDTDGRLHTRFNQAVAATGRLSSANPNLQNIPVRTELGQRIRRAFIAPPERSLLVADYSQIELRVLAHIAGEEALVAAFSAGEDIHRATAATVFGVAPELVSAEQRRAAKTINFGIIYGISGFGLGKNLGVSPKEADRFIKAYLDRYPKIRAYMDETLAAAKEEGKVETLYGRVRWLPDIKSRNWNLRENARRMAINARIQGTAADLMKLAMVRVARRLEADHPASRLLLTVHDELVLEVPEGEVEGVAAMVEREMVGVAELAVPLVVDVAWGRSWYEAKD